MHWLLIDLCCLSRLPVLSLCSKGLDPPPPSQYLLEYISYSGILVDSELQSNNNTSLHCSLGSQDPLHSRGGVKRARTGNTAREQKRIVPVRRKK